MAGVLSPAAFRALQALKRRTMRHTATVQAPTRVEGPGGTSTTSWTAKAGLADLPCAFAFDAPTDAIVADAVHAAVACRVELIPADLVTAEHITDKDRISIVHDVEGIASPLVLAVVKAQPRGADEVVRVVRTTLVAG